MSTSSTESNKETTSSSFETDNTSEEEPTLEFKPSEAKLEEHDRFNVGITSSAQLDLIDKLREIGVGDMISLPQLVVVGDQSSGKSSVLEAFSGLPFARDTGLCTRFATQITTRREAREQIRVSIIPAVGSSADKMEKISAFSKKDLPALTDKDFMKIFEEAYTVMGVSSTTTGQNSSLNTFSNDVLKFELIGPSRENLTMIDIPGIFRNSTEGLTTEVDKKLVHDMVTHYIKGDCTIILAVLPANVDIATQEILDLAQKADPSGIRTLGVLTKPDRVEANTEQGVLNLVKGISGPKLKLGYCVVKNRSSSEQTITFDQRAEKEQQFFNTFPWSNLPKDRVGVFSLKKRLQHLLEDLTRREIPKVKKEISVRLLNAKKELGILGVDRTNSDQQRIYLNQFASEFQKTTDHALDTYYSRSTAFDEVPELRLPTLVAERSDQFESEMIRFGHSKPFHVKKGEEKSEFVQAATEKDWSSLHKDNSKMLNIFPDLDGILPDQWTYTEDADGKAILAWIKEIHDKNRGYAIGVCGSSVLSILWKYQIKNWEGIALNFVSDICLHVHNFIMKLMTRICSDANVRRDLLNHIMEDVKDRYKLAINQVIFISRIESESTPLTRNPQFSLELKEGRHDELSSLFSEAMTIAPGKSEKYWDETENRKKIQRLLSKVNLDTSVNDLHTVLESYYKIAVRRFIDTVCMQGVDCFLMKDQSPLRIFGPDFVLHMKDTVLERIAGEDESTAEARKQLKKDIAALEQGSALLRF